MFSVEFRFLRINFNHLLDVLCIETMAMCLCVNDPLDCRDQRASPLRSELRQSFEDTCGIVRLEQLIR